MTKCPSTGEIWHIYMMKYYSSVTRSGLPTHATTRMDLNNITLGERSQSQHRIAYASLYMK